ncbi:hypothetical protein AVDCRST_MAG84-2766 [uncultured Microcoleus sp.]|uniref:Uncharacterized protein n=1 Tax=uncultured Microcoleus sp. TaxID=259945 RepID=A0A6J4M3X8_9CYAN|nr:hypothetical protein AVDCRST_MAG84-2766 [uncultured Microcoleus sp.]
MLTFFCYYEPIDCHKLLLNRSKDTYLTNREDAKGAKEEKEEDR